MRFNFKIFGNPLETLLTDTFKKLHIEFLKDLFSPGFFRAIPAMDLVSIGKKVFLSSNPNVDKHKAELNLILKPLNIKISDVKIDRGTLAGDLNTSERLLEIYFTQVLFARTAFLDLRMSTLSRQDDSSEYTWSPNGFCWTWSSEFQNNLRDIYFGYYLNDDDQFSKGLASLHLLHAKELFKSHFGSDTSRVIFKYQDFISIFTKVFSSCVEHKVTLHPEFMPFGVMLTFLYHSLNDSHQPLNVAAIFKKVVESQGDK